MPSFNTIQDRSGIPEASNGWESVQGYKKTVEYKGNKYSIIEKQEYKYSKLERLGRGLLGTALVAGTIGFGLLSKRVRGLFSRDHASRRFAELLPPSLPPTSPSVKPRNQPIPVSAEQTAKVKQACGKIDTYVSDVQAAVQEGKALIKGRELQDRFFQLKVDLDALQRKIPKGSPEAKKIQKALDDLRQAEKEFMESVSSRGRETRAELDAALEKSKAHPVEGLRYAEVRDRSKEAVKPVASEVAKQAEFRDSKAVERVALALKAHKGEVGPEKLREALATDLEMSLGTDLLDALVHDLLERDFPQDSSYKTHDERTGYHDAHASLKSYIQTRVDLMRTCQRIQERKFQGIHQVRENLDSVQRRIKTLEAKPSRSPNEEQHLARAKVREKELTKQLSKFPTELRDAGPWYEIPSVYDLATMLPELRDRWSQTEAFAELIAEKVGGDDSELVKMLARVYIDTREVKAYGEAGWKNIERDFRAFMKMPAERFAQIHDDTALEYQTGIRLQDQLHDYIRNYRGFHFPGDDKIRLWKDEFLRYGHGVQHDKTLRGYLQFMNDKIQHHLVERPE